MGECKKGVWARGRYTFVLAQEGSESGRGREETKFCPEEKEDKVKS